MPANSRLTTALHALAWLELASREGRTSLSSEQVAASLASNPALVRRVLAPLREAGLLKVGRGPSSGPSSGWSLGRPADEITLADVHHALKETSPFALHAHEPNQECPVGLSIRPALDEVYASVDAAITAQLRSTTIAVLLDILLAKAPTP